MTIPTRADLALHAPSGVRPGGPGAALRLRLAGAVATVIVLWGISFSGVRYCLLSFAPQSVALLRYLVASAVMLVLAGVLRPALPTRRELPRLLVIACCGVSIYNLLLSSGLEHMRAGPGAFINNSIPLFSTLLAVLVLRERPTALMWVGILVSLMGVAVIAVSESGPGGMSWSALLLVASAGCYACYNVFQKPLLQAHGAFWVVSWAIWLGTAMLLPCLGRLLADLHHASSGAVTVAALLGIFPTVVAFLLWSWALQRAAISALAPMLYLVPLVSLVAARVLLAERPARAALAGCAIVLTGVMLVARKRLSSSSLHPTGLPAHPPAPHAQVQPQPPPG